MKYRIREQNELKPSGVEWLGDIYKNWGIISIKRLIQILTDYTANGSFADLARNVTYLDKPDFARLIRLTDIRKDFKNDTGVYINKDSYKFLKKSSLFGNEILVANVGAYSGYSFLLPEKLDFKASLAPNMFLIKFKENKVLHKFIFYVLKSNIVLDKLIQLSISAAQPKLNKDNIKSLVIPFLSLLEQQKIANFLDEKSKIFDESISKKEQLISKLELAKQSLISEVVTGKLKIIENNSKLQTIKREQNELKPSGVEWLGDIPKDWEVKKLKYLVEVPLKYGANESAELIDKNLPRYIRITDFANDGLLKEDTFRSLSEDKAKDFILKDGDVLFARSGGTVGKTFQFKNYNGIACFAGYLISARPNKKIVTSDFIYLFTRTLNYQNWKNSIFMQATIQNIGADKYNELYFPYTKLEEQKQISKYLDEKLIHFDNTIEKTKQSIKKLKLAKEALISQAVTGKIEVL